MRLRATRWTGLAAIACLAPCMAWAQPAAPDAVTPAAVAAALKACATDPATPGCDALREALVSVLQPAASRNQVDRVSDDLDATATQFRAGAKAPSPTESETATGHGPGLTGQTLAPQGAAAVSLAASSDTKTATLALSFDPDFVPGYLSISAETPIGQDPTYQNIATLDGLTKSTNIGFQYNLVRPSVTSDRTALEGQPIYQRACHQILDDFVALYPLAKTDPGVINVGQSCAAGLLKAAIHAYISAHPSADFPQDKFDKALVALESETTDQIDHLLMFTANGKVGYESHTYFDGTSLKKNSVYRTPFQLGAAVTYLKPTPVGQVSITGGFNYQRAFNDGGATAQMQTLCPPTGHPVLKCIAGYIGAPTLSEKELLSVELRFIGTGWKLPFGIDPGATYDVHSGAYAFSFPIYLFTDASKALTGGVRYNWTSDKHRSVVGIFVASEFCVLPGVSACGPPPKSP